MEEEHKNEKVPKKVDSSVFAFDFNKLAAKPKKKTKKKKGKKVKKPKKINKAQKN